jgi:hypothetical protein
LPIISVGEGGGELKQEDAVFEASLNPHCRTISRKRKKEKKYSHFQQSDLPGPFSFEEAEVSRWYCHQRHFQVLL